MAAISQLVRGRFRALWSYLPAVPWSPQQWNECYQTCLRVIGRIRWVITHKPWDWGLQCVVSMWPLLTHTSTTVPISPVWQVRKLRPPTSQGAVRIQIWLVPKSKLFLLCWLNSFFFFNFIYLFIYFWLCWVFVSVRGLSLVAASGGHSSSRCAGLSLSRPLLLRSTGSRCAGSAIVAHGPSRSAACGIFPDQSSNPYPLHWQADSQPLRHQGSPWILITIVHLA